MKRPLARLMGAVALMAGVGCDDDAPKPRNKVEGPAAKIVSVEIEPAVFTLTVGESQTLEATVRGEGDFDPAVTWETSDAGIATVDAGMVTAVDPGEVTITATSEMDPTKVGSATVTVIPAPPRPGRLRLTIEGLPETVDAGVWVSRPGAFWDVAQKSRTYDDLAPGTYDIFATKRTEGDEPYYPMVLRSEAVVRSGETTEVVVGFVAESELMVRLDAAFTPLPHHGHAEMVVTIHRREGFDAPMTISQEALPQGVTAADVRVEAGEDQVAVRLESDGTHPVLGRHSLEVVARTDELLFRGEAKIDLRPVVTSLEDSGPGTLRHYVELAPQLETMEIYPSNPPRRYIPISFDPSLGEEVTIRLESPLVFKEGVDTEILTTIQVAGPQRDGEPLVTIEGDGEDRLMVVESRASVGLGNLILRGGSSSRGGAVANAGSLGVYDSRFEGNVAAEAGGAIENTGVLILENVSFLGNAAGRGGAISNLGWVDVNNGHFWGNAAAEEGGAIDNQGWLFIVDSFLVDNDARNGGALHVAAGSERTEMLRVLLERNTAEHGGGAHIEGPFSVVASSFVGNHASAEGGGLHALTSDDEDFFAQVLNSTFAQNVSKGQGGGVFITGDGRFELLHGTLAGNDASEGGGLFSQTEFRIAATLLAENDSASGGDLHAAAGAVSEGYNLFGALSGATFPLTDTDTVGVDPMLGELGNHGGQTPMIPLLPGSPAIDAIPKAQCLGQRDPWLTRDQRESLRPAGPGCDIGAYEAP